MEINYDTQSYLMLRAFNEAGRFISYPELLSKMHSIAYNEFKMGKSAVHLPTSVVSLIDDWREMDALIMNENGTLSITESGQIKLSKLESIISRYDMTYPMVS